VKRVWGALALAVLTGLCSAEAKAEESLTWKDCVLEARRDHPDLASAREKINQSQAGKMLAVSDLLPQITGTSTASTAKTAASKSTSPAVSSPKVNSYTYGLNGQQLVFDGFKTALDVEQAAKNVDSFRYNYAVTSSNVRLRLRTAFAALLRAQELVHLTEKIAERRRQNHEMIKLRYEAGRENRGSLLTAAADLSQAKFDVTQATRAIDLARRQLGKELGRTAWAPLEAKGNFSVSDRDKTRPDFDRMAETVPLLRQLIVQKEAAQYGFKSSQAAFFPQVYVSGSLGRTDAHWLPERNAWTAGASVSLPIFDGGALVSGLDKNRALYNQAQADEKSGRDGVLLTLERTWTAFCDARDQVDVQKRFLEAAEEREKISEAQYSSGLVSFNDWIIIENNLVTAEKSYLNARADALVAEANWTQAKGETLDEEQI